MKSGFLNKLRQESRLAPSALRLYYLAELEGAQLALRLVVAKRDPSGHLEQPQQYRILATHLELPPPFLDQDDVAILRALWRGQNDERADEPYLTHAGLTPKWCEQLAATGRLLFAPSLRSVELGPTNALSVEWVTGSDGTQVLRWSTGEHCHLLALESPCYLDTEHCCLGAYTSDYSSQAVDLVYQQAPLTWSLVDDFFSQRAGLFQSLGLPLPQSYALRREQGEPTPHLRLRSAEGHDSLVLGFDYECDQRVLSLDGGNLGANGEDCESVSESQTLSSFYDNTITVIARDIHKERDYLQILRDQVQAFSPHYTSDYCLSFPRSKHWQEVVIRCLPHFKGMGWRVDIDPGFRFNFIDAAKFSASVLPDASLSAEQSWFDFSLSVELDGESVALLPLLSSAAKRFTFDELQAMPADEKLPFHLPDGRILLIAAQRVALWFSVLVELDDSDASAADDGPVHLRLPLSQLARMHALDEDEALEWEDPAALTAVQQTIKQAPPLAALKLPSKLNAQLREYQLLGLAWLQQRCHLGVGGILADDMGLGKTLQTLSHMALEKDQGRLDKPALIVAPRSVMNNWINEAAKFVPHLRCFMMHGTKRHDAWSSLHRYDLIITSYHCVLNDVELWQQQALHSVVLDEAQSIKNAHAKITKAIKQLDAQSKLCLTGTPMENHLGELWSLFDFISPGLLGTEKFFNRHYRIPIERYFNKGRAESLLTMITPFMLRRKKHEVAKDLPPKTEIIVRLPLEKEQRDIYEALRVSTIKELSAQMHSVQDSQGRVMILNALMKLRQACCDPKLLKDVEQLQDAPSAKRERLLTMVEELIDEGRSILVFSQFTSMLDLIAADLREKNIDHLMLTGKTRDRDALVKQFQQGERQVFLISLKAGGTGLTLTKADTVIHYDPWWNSSAEQQASDRAHRIGQDKPVFIYKLIAENTIEEKIQNLQEKKKDLLENIYRAAESGSQRLALDNAELLALMN